MEQANAGTALVHITRNGGAVTVDPWSLKLKRGQQVEWVLSGSDDEVTITRKPDPKQWLFDKEPPYKGNKTQRPKSGKMRDKAAEGRYPYNVELSNGGAKLVIDPEMILPPPGGG